MSAPGVGPRAAILTHADVENRARAMAAKDLILGSSGPARLGRETAANWLVPEVQSIHALGAGERVADLGVTVRSGLTIAWIQT